MDTKEEFLKIIESIQDIDEDLCKQLIYLRPYYVYNRVYSERDEVKEYIDNLSFNGKTRQTYYDECPKYDDFVSNKKYFVARAKHKLLFIEDALDSVEFKEDYNRLLFKLLRFVNNINDISPNDAQIKYNAFAREIVKICAKYNIPYLQTLKFASQQYQISMYEAMRLMNKNLFFEEEVHKMR